MTRTRESLRTRHPRFTPKTLSFLRALKRNNRRDWFAARKSDYETHVRAPMIAVVEQLARDFRRIAPELDASPKRCLYRIYRDTRFSDDKAPYKTNVAAAFRWRGLRRGEGAGLYVEVTPGWVWFGGGFYDPETPHLVRIREHISETYPEIDRIARRASFRQAVGSLDGERLTRVPRGFAKDDPSAEYLKFRSFLAGRETKPEFATTAEFYPALVSTFRAILPLVRFLNEPLVGEPLARKTGTLNISEELQQKC
jgi:uncharacterized protein (TIGR02453 family)